MIVYSIKNVYIARHMFLLGHSMFVTVLVAYRQQAAETLTEPKYRRS